MVENIISTIKYILCCKCCRKNNGNTYIISEENDREYELKEKLLKDKSTKFGIKTSAIKKNSFLEIENMRIIESDLVKEKDVNPNFFYEKLAELGEGAFGQVLKVRNKQTGAVRAMKIIKKNDLDEINENNLSDKSDDTNFEEEARLLKNLSHPNIIKIYEVYNYNNAIYLVEEFIRGGDLFSKIEKMTSLSEKITLIIMKQIFSAVNYLHFNNIIHGDLKLENIMVESLIKRRATLVLSDDKSAYDFDIKIIDFGCSTMISKGKTLKKLIGTIYYLAPEVINGSYNNKCDIWSCGVIMYTLLTGKFPFTANTNEEIFECIKKGNYSLNEKEFQNISDQTKNLIKRCLERNPYERISALEALTHDCFKNLDYKDSQNYDKQIFQRKNTFDPVIGNLKNIKKRLSLQKALIKFITFNIVKQEDMVDIRNFYKIMDENDDGYLTVEELYQGLLRSGTIFNTSEFDKIIENIDTQKTGIIEYEDFISACIDKNKVTEESNLKQAFEMLDTDGSGEIDVNEIKAAFGISDKILDEDIINELVKELNDQNVKTIDFNTFKKFVSRAFEDDNLDSKSKSKAKSKKSKFAIYDKKDNFPKEDSLDTSTKITI